MTEPMQNLYPAMLSPLKVGRFTLSNRVAMGAMHTGIEKRDRPLERITAFYKARVDGEVGLIVSGGVSPSFEGRLDEGAPYLDEPGEKDWHGAIIDAVRGSDTLMCMQLLHAGRYAKVPDCVAPSAIKASINKFVPRALSTEETWQCIEDFVRAAEAAHEFGYHAVEVMGSEGYLINQFTSEVTNQRDDEFGGSFENRVRFALEIVRRIRDRLGDRLLVIYRLSMVDLVRGGMTGEETLELARLIEAAGADIINTGIGWHEANIPTVAHVVPRAAWAYATRRIKEAVACPVMASNRINDPTVADDLIASGAADLVSMARPLLADPDFVRKARLGHPERIDTCIACNQACLDRAFRHQPVSCLVNPIAGFEIDYKLAPAAREKRLAVVGAGAAGMNFAFHAASRGHSVTLFEASEQLGGQLLLARVVPDKSEFNEMLRYFAQRLTDEAVDVRYSCRPSARQLADGGFDEVVIATGVLPREVDIPGIDHANVLSYAALLRGEKAAGRKVAIIGAGGIAFDVAEYLLNEPCAVPAMPAFAAEYGIDLSMEAPGGLLETTAAEPPKRDIVIMQRTDRVPSGNRQAVSTNWIKRDRLRRQDVRMLGGVTYRKIDGEGVHIVLNGQPTLIEADTIVICAGQYSERGLYEELKATAPDLPIHVIGGADEAVELDAMRAITQATQLAFSI